MLRLTRHSLRRATALPSAAKRLASTSSTPEDCDIVIVGGGPVGLALSSALSSSKVVNESLSIALVEAGDLSKVKGWKAASDAYSNRVSSLTNASEAFLQDIGAWKFVEEERTCPVEEMQVWDGISDARIAFSSQDHLQQPQMARLTENLNLQRALLRHLAENPSGVRIMDKTKVSQIETSESKWPLVHLDNGKVIRARLLVGADGPNSPVRHYAQIPTYGWSYPTHAIVATLNHSTPYLQPNTTAFQRFLPTGPIAFLPLTPTISSLVWSTTPAVAKALLSAPPEVLPAMINAAFRLPDVSMKYLQRVILERGAEGVNIRDEILFREKAHGIPLHDSCVRSGDGEGGIPPLGSEMLPPLVHSVQQGTAASFPLRYNHTETYIGENGRTALVGDAAHSVHPLAGQGLNLGLGDVQELARCIEEGVRTGADIGSITCLSPYPRARYLTNHTVMSTCDKLHKLYSSEGGSNWSPIVWARSVGLEVLNEMDGVKAGVMGVAGGSNSKFSNRMDNGRSSVGQAGWGALAKGFEMLGTGIDAAKVVKGALGNVVESYTRTRR